jgi:hypothetical protein
MFDVVINDNVIFSTRVECIFDIFSARFECSFDIFSTHFECILQDFKLSSSSASSNALTVEDVNEELLIDRLKYTLETSREVVKNHSKRVEKMGNTLETGGEDETTPKTRKWTHLNWLFHKTLITETMSDKKYIFRNFLDEKRTCLTLLEDKVSEISRKMENQLREKEITHHGKDNSQFKFLKKQFTK